MINFGRVKEPIFAGERPVSKNIIYQGRYIENSLTFICPSVTLLFSSGERRKAYEPDRKQNQCGGGKREPAGRAEPVDYAGE